MRVVDGSPVYGRIRLAISRQLAATENWEGRDMITRESPRVVVVGAASVDIKGKASTALLAATSNAGEIRTSVGGVARNVAENLGRLGVETTLLSAVGDDGQGRLILDRTARGGVNLERVLRSPDHRSGAYLAVLDADGGLWVSIDDMGIIELVTPQYIRANRDLFKEADMVFMDANLFPQTIRSVISIARREKVPVCVDPVSVALAPRLSKHLDRASVITANIYEADVLTGMSIRERSQALEATRRLLSMGVEIAIVTMAERGLAYASSKGSGHIPAIPCEVVDLTGAGAALAAGVIFGLANEMPIDEAVRLGVSAAALTLQSSESVCQDLNLERLYEQLVI
jgi:pseudouridine kinase